MINVVSKVLQHLALSHLYIDATLCLLFSFFKQPIVPMPSLARLGTLIQLLTLFFIQLIPTSVRKSLLSNDINKLSMYYPQGEYTPIHQFSPTKHVRLILSYSLRTAAPKNNKKINKQL